MAEAACAAEPDVSSACTTIATRRLRARPAAVAFDDRGRWSAYPAADTCALGTPRVIMLPDEYLARNIAAQTEVEIIAWKGHCEVHERFSPEDIRELRASHPGITVLAHPECPPEVVAECDFAGSTAAMAGYVGRERPSRVVLLTECSMSDNVALQYPDVDFVRPCNLCPHMKRITLKNIRHALETMTHEVTVAPDIAARARTAVERMLAIG